MADKKGAAAHGGGKPRAGLTKMEGVRRAQAALGKGAKPLAIQKYVKDELGIDISTSVISTYKKQIARRAKKGSAKGKPAPAAASAPQPPAATKRAAGGIPLGDILTVKELVERLGAAPLHTLIDAFAR